MPSDKKDTVKKKKRFTWFKNIFKSVNVLYRDALLPEVPGLMFVDGVFMTANQARKKGKKGIKAALVKINNIDKAKALKKFLIEHYLEGEETIDNAKAIVKEVKHRVTTGKLLENRNRRETGRRNGEGREMNELLEYLDELDDFDLDDFGEGGSMIRDNLEMNRLRLTKHSFAESLSAISKMENANKVIGEACEYVLDKSKFCSNLEKNEVNDIVIDKTITDMKNRIKPIITEVAKIDDADKTYADTLGSAMTVIMETEAEYEVEAPTQSNVTEVLENIAKEQEDLEKISPRVAEVYTNQIEDSVDNLLEMKDDLVFDPVIDKENEPTLENKLTAVAERKTYAEDFGALGLGSAINTVMMVPALLSNVYLDRRNRKFQTKFGTTANLRQPLIASNRLSNETVRQLSKALEVRSALQIKAVLESTVSAMDGGLVTKRLRVANVLSPAKIDVKDAKLFANAPMSYEQILGVFSESGLSKEVLYNANLGIMSTDHMYIIPSMMSHFRRNHNDLHYSFLHEEEARGETGIEIESKRAALPTYLTVSINHELPKSMVSFDRNSSTTDTVVSVEITPKVLPSSEIVECIKENSFSKVKVTKEEQTFAKRFKSILKFWSKKKGTPQGRVLETSAMKRIASKVSNISTPLFHVMLEYQDYLDLKAKGADLLNEKVYKELMSELPIISITIVVEDTETVYFSEGAFMGFTKRPLKDYVDATAQLEKELRSDIKFRHNL